MDRWLCRRCLGRGVSSRWLYCSMAGGCALMMNRRLLAGDRVACLWRKAWTFTIITSAFFVRLDLKPPPFFHHGWRRFWPETSSPPLFNDKWKKRTSSGVVLAILFTSVALNRHQVAVALVVVLAAVLAFLVFGPAVVIIGF